MTEALAVRGLHVVLHRDGVPATVLRGVDLDVARGRIVALVGESGSGKSTIGLAAAGLLPGEAAPLLRGSIRVAAHEMTRLDEASRRRVLRRHVGVVFQDPMTSLNPTMRVRTQLAEALDRPDPLDGHLRRVGFADPARALDAYPHTLSGGQRQRVMIAMALARQPDLVIADEPTTALDVTVQAEVLALLGRLCREHGAGALFITHDLAVARAIADEVVVLYAGRVMERGPASRVTERPAHPYTAMLLAARFGLDTDRSRPVPAPREVAGLRAACVFSSRCPLVQRDCPDADPLPGPDGVASACVRRDAVEPGLWSAKAEAWPPVAATPAPLLAFERVGKTFPLRGGARRAARGRFRALHDVSLRIGAGEAVAVVGESGSGKSTLLRLAAGLLAPDEGRIVRADSRDRPQVVFQDAAASFTPWLTVGEQIAERLRPLRLDAAARRARVAETLRLVGLDPALAGSRASALSGGQSQRAAIARAIAVPPRLLLCDEAVSALNVSLAATILNLIGDLRRRLGMALLFVTHDLAAAWLVADRVVVLQAGAVAETGPVESVLAAPAHDYTRRLLASVPDRLERAA